VSDIRVGTKEEWLAARLELLAKEKELNRRRDELAAERRRLPSVPVDDDYAFDGHDAPRPDRSPRPHHPGRLAPRILPTWWLTARGSRA